MLDFSANHFELFGLPLSYRIDPVLLAERYRSLQQALHPDRFAAASERERRLSMQASTQVNAAFQTLNNPLQRAQYLLSLQTGEVAAETETTQDMAFLAEQMALREALAEAEEESDPMGAVARVLERLADQSGLLDAQLAAVLEAPTGPDVEAARELLRKLRFIAKCRREAEDLEARLSEAL